jgi:hypothetical protein
MGSLTIYHIAFVSVLSPSDTDALVGNDNELIELISVVSKHMG